LEIRKALRPNFTACIVDTSTNENEYRMSCLIQKQIREVPFNVTNAGKKTCISHVPMRLVRPGTG